jgi:hypothetical protein
MKTYPLWFKRLIYRLARRIQRCDERQHRSNGARKGWDTRRKNKIVEAAP